MSVSFSTHQLPWTIVFSAPDEDFFSRPVPIVGPAKKAIASKCGSGTGCAIGGVLTQEVTKKLMTRLDMMERIKRQRADGDWAPPTLGPLQTRCGAARTMAASPATAQPSVAPNVAISTTYETAHRYR